MNFNNQIKNRRIILASESPRRAELLKQIGLNFEIKPSAVDEGKEPKESLESYVKRVALSKAEKAADACRGERPFAPTVIIAADTIVILNKKRLGKPESSESATAMLKKLSGRCHTVMTGVAVVDTVKNKKVTKVASTKVWFKKLTDEEIKEYVKSSEPLDKAGGYGIQGKAAVFVKKIEGDYFNIVGLPLNTLYEMLAAL
ncbi:MAG: septum formation inhibitor Maf [Nitrospirae bacterium]|nr:septum formation inhibitor Maf [Nitrospirota bacterium]